MSIITLTVLPSNSVECLTSTSRFSVRPSWRPSASMSLARWIDQRIADHFDLDRFLEDRAHHRFGVEHGGDESGGEASFGRDGHRRGARRGVVDGGALDGVGSEPEPEQAARESVAPWPPAAGSPGRRASPAALASGSFFFCGAPACSESSTSSIGRTAPRLARRIRVDSNRNRGWLDVFSTGSRSARIWNVRVRSSRVSPCGRFAQAVGLLGRSAPACPARRGTACSSSRSRSRRDQLAPEVEQVVPLVHQRRRARRASLPRLARREPLNQVDQRPRAAPRRACAARRRRRSPCRKRPATRSSTDSESRTEPFAGARDPFQRGVGDARSSRRRRSSRR